MDNRTSIEINFFTFLNKGIDQLVRDNFLEQDVLEFVSSMKTFLKFEDIKDFVKESLYDKTIQLSSVIHIAEETWTYSHRKFIALLILLDNDELMEMLETNFVKERRLNNFFILIEEKLKQNKSVENCETLFLSLMTIKSFINVHVVDMYLQAICRDRSYMVQKLITTKSYSALRRYISEISETDINCLEMLIPVIVERYYDRLNSHYLDLVATILTYSKEFTAHLLPSRNLEKMFEQYCSSSIPMPIRAITNYALYLSNKNKALFDKFETAFVEYAAPLNIVSFASDVPGSNKRKLLNKLIESRETHESSLVMFIKQFPEFENLLPML